MAEVKKKKKIRKAKEENIHTCPLLSDFKFNKRCSIKTCQHYNLLTERRCLSLDRKVSSDAKTFTDKELLLYKFPKNTTLRDVSTKRRFSLAQIRNITALYYFVHYISENYPRKNNYVTGEDPNLDELISKSNLVYKQLGIKFSWMLPHIINESTFEKFGKSKTLSSDVTIKTMVGLTNSDYKLFIEKVKGLTNT